VDKVTITFADGSDALDSAAWYIDGEYIGTDDQILMELDVLPKADGKMLNFRIIRLPYSWEIRHELYEFYEDFMWPSTEEDLVGAVAAVQAYLDGTEGDR